MRMLVLGGTAWLGREIARRALEEGWEVSCLARGESGAPPEGVRLVTADRTQRGVYEEVPGDWDAVVDVARQPGQVRSAVAALGARAGHWTLVSTGNVYADLSVPLTEDSPLREPLVGDVAGMEEYGEGKVACEQAVRGLSNHTIWRAGLIGGPGDPSDRFGYWVSRFALAGAGPVLVPDVPDQPVQVVDVRDLAAWIVRAAHGAVAGCFNACGDQLPFADVLDLAGQVAGFAGKQVRADPQWLLDHEVEHWMGARSLPLWLPDDHLGMVQMSPGRARAAGFVPRPLEDTLAATLEDERARGLDRGRRAGLSRADELALLADQSSSAG
ncbi:MAG TPA: NAD-dependent epimerase/dehydratase family protein [Marmoricola sp.]|nr:NAD-dependent epimerase/dehydratase family protein [Marmoricola sp.]